MACVGHEFARGIRVRDEAGKRARRDHPSLRRNGHAFKPLSFPLHTNTLIGDRRSPRKFTVDDGGGAQNQPGVLSVTSHRFPSMMSVRWLWTSARKPIIGRRAGLGTPSG